MDLPNTTVVMITIPERAMVCNRTLLQLATVDIAVNFVSVQGGQDRGMAAHTRNVIRALEASTTQYTLFLEDDLDIASTFRQAVEDAIVANKQVVTFYVSSNVSFYPAAIRHFLRGERERPLSGLYKLCNRKRFFGSQALLLRRDAVQRVLTGWDTGFFDVRVATLCADFWLYFPNPVQHYGARYKSTWSPFGHKHRSLTYGL